MDYQNIIYQEDGRIARITLNRPEKMNALSYPLIGELCQALKQAERDQKIRVIIIKGAGRCFSAGYDLTSPQYQDKDTQVAPEVASKDHIYGHQQAWFTIYDLLKPVIAQVHGYCLAGASELAFMCDITVMAENALTGYPPVRNLSSPDTLFHPWLMGMKRAKMMLFTGDALTGKEAAQMGLASAAVPETELEEFTNQLAEKVANIPTDLISLTKSAINQAYDIMGFRTAIMACGRQHDLAKFIPSAAEFRKTIQSKGLKDALQKRDSPFEDYSTKEK